MNKFEKIKSANIDELVEWMSEYCDYDNAPWWDWWDKKYCKKCQPEIGRYEGHETDMEFSWCELYGKCKFFQEMDNIPDVKQTIKMWLEIENEEK